MTKRIFHDDVWKQMKCRQHGRVCHKYIRASDDMELHVKIREPKSQPNNSTPPCIGCKGKRKAQS